MPTADDVNNLFQTKTASLISDIQSAYLAYKSNVPYYNESQSTTVELQQNLNEINRKKEELHRVEQTYDREFLDRVNTPPPAKGFFSKFGLVATQDWVMALFFMSYITFSIAISIFIVVRSDSKINAMGIALFIILVLGLMTGLLIFKYA